MLYVCDNWQNKYLLKNNLQRLELSADEMQAFMDIWTTVENQLQSFTGKRFPKIDFFINKILEYLDISKQPSYKISDALRKKYEIMWEKIV